MVFFRRSAVVRLLLLAAILALLVIISSVWLPQGDCGGGRQPCWIYSRPSVSSLEQWAESDEAPPLIDECPGQSFQTSRLLLCLRSSLMEADDVLLDPYLQGWDQLLRFMESLGTMVGLFSQKVREKVDLIRELSLRTSPEAQRGPADLYGLQTGAYRSLRSMVEAELNAGVVDFSRRSDSGCRTLLRLHRSLLWLQLMLQGLSEGPDQDGHYKNPGELSRSAYRVALAPHHPWVLRQAAELVFLALPDRHYFLRLVCVESDREAAPILRVIIRALALVHTQTQQILAEYDMLELP